MKTTYTEDRNNWMIIALYAFDKKCERISMKSPARKRALEWAAKRAFLKNQDIDSETFTWKAYGQEMQIKMEADAILIQHSKEVAL